MQRGYLPLWPFGSASAVAAWQAAYREGGHQPWHLSSRDVALDFAGRYLGYSEVDRVTATSGTARDHLVGVGWLDPNGKATTVALVHLLRWGTATDAPWEVVGTHDTRLTLTRPRYGSTVTSPMTVGGTITGVDENLRVAVHTLSAAKPVGVSQGVPAGGEATPWSVKVAFSAPAGAVLTVSVSTGGHLMAIEAFAVTGVRAGTTP